MFWKPFDIIDQIRVMVKYIQNYALYQAIGSGVYGKVYRAVNSQDNKEYAVKVIPISKFRQNRKLEDCTVNEINILTSMERHHHIIRYYDMLKTTNNFYFIYEYCNGGTLQSLIARYEKLPIKQALLIFKQLLDAFQTLNKYNIMHRDLKPDNIFLHNGSIKLGDFGFCKNLSSAEDMTKTMLGSPIYMAPQVLKGEVYSNKSDIWSLGVILYQMIFGKCPFESNSIANLIEALKKKQLVFPSPITPFLKQLISRMLTKDPFKRIQWMQLFQLKITDEGQINSQSLSPQILSLNDAKVSNQQSTLNKPNTNEFLTYSTSSQVEDHNDRNFKKRNTIQMESAITHPSSSSISHQNSIGYSNGANSGHLNPNFGNQNGGYSNSNDYANGSNGHHNGPINQNGSISLTKANINIINGSQGHMPNQQGNHCTQNTAAVKRLLDDHFSIIEGVRLAMEVVDNKLSNHISYAYLLLLKAQTYLIEFAKKSGRKDLELLVEKELIDIKTEREAIGTKMYTYELKGIEDWKKYMRYKFSDEQKNLSIWYRIVCYLNGNMVKQLSLPQKSMLDAIKSILY